MMKSMLISARTIIGICLMTCAGAAAEESVSDRAAQLLVRRCLECHSGAESQGKLDLTSRAALIRGGDSGSALDESQAGKSLIWTRVAADEMPPKKPLAPEEKQLLRSWLNEGAKYGVDPLSPWEFTTPERAGKNWWSLQPLQHVLPPDSLNDAALSPIDAFHQHELQAAGLTASSQADRRVLIRRITFDLLGLPPTPEEIDEFLAEESPDASERLMDRLLASPHYGERWARHWLDVVRYGESNGFERDLPRPHAWHYRDWVISAFNADLPYAAFVRRQIAGDPDDPHDAAASLGFLVAGPHDTVVPVSENMRKSMRFDELEDVLGTIGQTFLGLTINCARCHDHKFDPISQTEYYQLTAALAGVDHGERDMLPIGQTIADASAPGAVKIYTAMLNQPGPVHFLRRGNVTEPGDVMSPGSLAALPAGQGEFQLTPDSLEQQRRIALAEWLTASDNALATRTIVNRLWHYHFGGGFIETPNDLGFNGGRPSHPELFEWLCGEFQRTNGGIKQFHRLVINSTVYRQSSTMRHDAYEKDAGNRQLWRMNPRRLEAESVRDAMLCVSGELNDTLGGSSYQDFNSYFFKGTQFYEPIDADDANVRRRTVYRMWARGGRSPFLDTFDCPDPSTPTPKRSTTTTPLQALALMNNAFSLRMAERLAGRVDTEFAANPQAKIAGVYRFAYGRTPLDVEIVAAQKFIERRGMVDFCRVILNSSEFLYVE